MALGSGSSSGHRHRGSGSDVCLNVYHKRTDEQKYVLNIYVLSMNVYINIILNTSMGNSGCSLVMSVVQHNSLNKQ